MNSIESRKHSEAFKEVIKKEIEMNDDTLENAISKLVANLAVEASARADAVTSLQGAIDAEASTRAAADSCAVLPDHELH